MLDQKLIPLGKLKQAFDLNEREAEKVVSAIWPYDVLPYYLWEMAHKYHWEFAIPCGILTQRAKEIASLPKFDPLEHKVPLLNIYRTRIIEFFNEVAATVFVTGLIDGLNYIMELTYDKNDVISHDDFQYLLGRLSHIESGRNPWRPSPFEKRERLTPENFQDLFDEKATLIASYSSMPSLSELFIDSICVDKTAAVRHLRNCGYEIHNGVKGFSQALFERIIADTSTPQAVENVPQPPLLPAPVIEDTPSQPPAPVIEDTPSQPPAPVIEDTQIQPPAPVIEDTQIQPPAPVIEDTQIQPPAPVIEDTQIQPPPLVIEDTPQTSPQASESDPQPTTSQVIKVPRHLLLKGKRHPAIRDNLRKHDFSDPVIAYVLHEWCGLTNKTELGRILRLPKKGKNPSTFLRYANKLLNEAKSLVIIPA
jgi:hypothetical protein